MKCTSLLLWATLPTLATSFLTTRWARSNSNNNNAAMWLSPSAAAAVTDNNNNWNTEVIEKLQSWATEMQTTMGTKERQPTAHIQRSASSFTAELSLDDINVITAEEIEIHFVTVGQQPFLTIAGPNNFHQGVAVDGAVDLKSMQASLLPGNVLRITGVKNDPLTSGFRLAVVDRREEE